MEQWKDEEKKRKSDSILTGSAHTCIVNQMRSYPEEDYKAWKKSFKLKFSHPAEGQKLMIKFEGLRQNPGQLVQQFVEEIENTHDPIFRKNNTVLVSRMKQEKLPCSGFLCKESAPRLEIPSGMVLLPITTHGSLQRRRRLLLKLQFEKKTHNNQTIQWPANSMVASDHVA